MHSLLQLSQDLPICHHPNLMPSSFLKKNNSLSLISDACMTMDGCRVGHPLEYDGNLLGSIPMQQLLLLSPAAIIYQ